jgi:hypothetical protein
MASATAYWALNLRAIAIGRVKYNFAIFTANQGRQDLRRDVMVLTMSTSAAFSEGEWRT